MYFVLLCFRVTTKTETGRESPGARQRQQLMLMGCFAAQSVFSFACSLPFGVLPDVEREPRSACVPTYFARGCACT